MRQCDRRGCVRAVSDGPAIAGRSWLSVASSAQPRTATCDCTASSAAGACEACRLPLKQRAMTARAGKQSSSKCADRIAARLHATFRQTRLAAIVSLAVAAARFDRQRVRHFTALLPSAVEQRTVADSCGHAVSAPTSEKHPTDIRAAFAERPVRQPPSSFLIAQRRGWCHPPNPVFWTLAPASGARHFAGHSVCYWLTLSSRHNRHRTPPERARQSRFAAGIRIISERLSSAMSAEQEDRRGLSANPKRPRRAV